MDILASYTINIDFGTIWSYIVTYGFPAFKVLLTAFFGGCLFRFNVYLRANKVAVKALDDKLKSLSDDTCLSLNTMNNYIRFSNNQKASFLNDLEKLDRKMDSISGTVRETVAKAVSEVIG